MLGEVRAGQTVGDYSPSAWTFNTSQVEIIHVQTNHSPIMRHHSCHSRRSPEVLRGPLQSSAVPCHPSSFLAVPNCPQPSLTSLTSPALGAAVLYFHCPGWSTDTRPGPSRALGSRTPPDDWEHC